MKEFSTMALTVLEKDQSLEILRDGRPLTVYRFGQQFTKPHFWPIIGPGDVAVTRQFPHVPDSADEAHDHPHHQGLHFTHGELAFPSEPMVDFWAVDAKVQGRIVHRGFTGTPGSSGTSVDIAAHNQWLAPDGRVMIEDHTSWRIADLGAEATLFTVQIDLRPAGQAISFGDTKEGSFSIRVPTWMDEQRDATGPRSGANRGRITNSEGGMGEGQCWGRHADWVDYSGELTGRRVGVSLFDHPENMLSAYWHVRGYGLFAANPFGSRAFGEANPPHELRLEPGQSLRLAYGVFIHGEVKPEQIAEQFKKFASTPLR